MLRVRDALHGVHDFSKYNFRTIGAAELLDDARRGDQTITLESVIDHCRAYRVMWNKPPSER